MAHPFRSRESISSDCLAGSRGFKHSVTLVIRLKKNQVKVSTLTVINSKNQGFLKVVRANAITPRKRQKSALKRHRPYSPLVLLGLLNACFHTLYHAINALTSEHQNTNIHLFSQYCLGFCCL